MDLPSWDLVITTPEGEEVLRATVVAANALAALHTVLDLYVDNEPDEPWRATVEYRVTATRA